MPDGTSTAGALTTVTAKKPIHSHDAQMRGVPRLARSTAMVAPVAATRTSATRPIARSASTTVVASVFDRAGRALSRMRITSPPMLLGRKLLKKRATRYESMSRRRLTCTCCASSSRCQRQTLAATFSA